MVCAQCPKRVWCLMACDEVNAELVRADEQVERLDYRPPVKPQSVPWVD